MSNITDRIDRLLEQKGMRKKDFYAAIGITPAAYSQWRLGQSKPTLGRLQRAAVVLGVDLADIISEKRATTYANTPLLDTKKAATSDGDGLLLRFALYGEPAEDITAEDLERILDYAKYIREKRKGDSE